MQENQDPLTILVGIHVQMIKKMISYALCLFLFVMERIVSGCLRKKEKIRPLEIPPRVLMDMQMHWLQ